MSETETETTTTTTTPLPVQNPSSLDEARTPTTPTATTTRPVTFSIVIATAGRPTHTETLNAATPQLQPGDEIIVVRDNTGDYGNTPRNHAIPRCTGTHILFIDDDDQQHTPDALETIRRHVADQPQGVHLRRHALLRRPHPHPTPFPSASAPSAPR